MTGQLSSFVEKFGYETSRNKILLDELCSYTSMAANPEAIEDWHTCLLFGSYGLFGCRAESKYYWIDKLREINIQMRSRLYLT